MKLMSLTFASILFLVCTSAAAQQPKLYRIGYLSSSDKIGNAPRREGVRQALRDRGYIDGQNIAIEYRYADGKQDRYPELAAELVKLNVDLIVASGGAATIRAAKNATKTIPIVMVGPGVNPVEAGFIESVSHPGGNITGITSLITELSGKRLELLKETVPKAAVVAVLYHPATSSSVLELKEVQAAAHSLKLSVRPWEVHVPDDFEKVFGTVNKDRPDGIFVSRSSLTSTSIRQIVRLALKNRLPSAYTTSEAVVGGGLMYYGADETDGYRRIAYYIDRIFKGAKPGDLPVEQPTKLELVINAKTAKEIGLTIPPNVLARADRVIR